MRKIIAVVIAVLFTLPFTGCQKENSAGSRMPSAGTQAPVSRGITVNKIPFTVISDFTALPESMKMKIDETKDQKGFYVFDNKQYGINEEGYYVLINAGEKPTLGYNINVTGVEDNEGITIIFVEERSPEKGKMEGEVITYPSTLIKIKGVTPSIKVVTKEGESYRNLSLESKPQGKMKVQIKNAVYVGQIDGNSIEVKVDNNPMALYVSNDIKKSYNFDQIKTGEKVKIEYVVNENKQNVLMAIEKVTD